MTKSATSTPASKRIRISVVIPVRNEESSIQVLLDNLLAQTRPPDEIVITDGGSTDRTPEIIQSYIDRGAPVLLVREGPAYPGRGRNLAAARASNEWLAFIDGGIRPEKDWLDTLAARAESDAEIDVVYGMWEPVTDSFFKECAVISYVPAPSLHDGVVTRPDFIASSLMRREVWSAVGGFPEHLRSAEDLLYMREVRERGYKIVYEPSARVNWNVQPNLWQTFKRFVTYSRNNIRAGLWRSWQAAIFRRYALLLALALPALFLGWWWLVVPLLAWLLMLGLRGFASLRRNRGAYPAGAARNALRLMLLMPIIAMLDAAAFTGTLNWLVKDKIHLGRNETVRVGDGA